MKEKCSKLTNSYTFFSFEENSTLYKKLVWNDSKLPKQVDLRKSGLLQQPIDQGTCGSCYAIATMYA